MLKSPPRKISEFSMWGINLKVFSSVGITFLIFPFGGRYTGKGGQFQVTI